MILHCVKYSTNMRGWGWEGVVMSCHSQSPPLPYCSQRLEPRPHLHSTSVVGSLHWTSGLRLLLEWEWLLWNRLWLSLQRLLIELPVMPVWLGAVPPGQRVRGAGSGAIGSPDNLPLEWNGDLSSWNQNQRGVLGMRKGRQMDLVLVDGPVSSFLCSHSPCLSRV